MGMFAPARRRMRSDRSFEFPLAVAASKVHTQMLRVPTTVKYLLLSKPLLIQFGLLGKEEKEEVTHKDDSVTKAG